MNSLTEDTFSTKVKSTNTTTNRRTRHQRMQADFMYWLYKNDFTVKEIAIIYNISTQTVTGMINKNLAIK